MTLGVAENDGFLHMLWQLFSSPILPENMGGLVLPPYAHVNPSLPIEQEPPIGFHCPKRHVAKPYATRPSVTPTVFYLYIERRNKSITVNTTFFSAI